MEGGFSSIPDFIIHLSVLTTSYIFKPGARWPQAGACLVSRNFHVVMCAYAPEAINN